MGGFDMFNVTVGITISVLSRDKENAEEAALRYVEENKDDIIKDLDILDVEKIGEEK